MSEIENNENDKSTKNIEVDPRILTAIKMMELSFANSRAYSDTVDTEEKRIEQSKRIDKALELVKRREIAAYWSENADKRRF